MFSIFWSALKCGTCGNVRNYLMTFCHCCYHGAVSLLLEEVMNANTVFLSSSSSLSTDASEIMRGGGIHKGMLTLAEFHGIRYIIHVTHPPSSVFYSWSETEQQHRNHLGFHLPPITRYFRPPWMTWVFWSVCSILIRPTHRSGSRKIPDTFILYHQHWLMQIQGFRIYWFFT